MSRDWRKVAEDVARVPDPLIVGDHQAINRLLNEMGSESRQFLPETSEAALRGRGTVGSWRGAEVVISSHVPAGELWVLPRRSWETAYLGRGMQCHCGGHSFEKIMEYGGVDPVGYVCRDCGARFAAPATAQRPGPRVPLDPTPMETRLLEQDREYMTRDLLGLLDELS